METANYPEMRLFKPNALTDAANVGSESKMISPNSVQRSTVANDQSAVPYERMKWKRAGERALRAVQIRNDKPSMTFEGNQRE